MKAYLINLDDRRDRLEYAERQLSAVGVEYLRVAAIRATEKFSTEYPYVTPSVAAIWLSHLSALREFLETDETHALILEDDFQMKCSKKKLYSVLLEHEYGDFFQIGFLVTNLFDRINFCSNNFLDFSFKVLEKYSRYRFPFANYLSTKYLVYGQKNAKFSTVCNDIRAGAHSYIISREFAEKVLEFNQPVLFSTDQFFISLSKMHTFRMLRLRSSIIGQTDSISSVQSRFISQKND